MATCQFCLREFALGGSAVRVHQSKNPDCKKARDKQLETLMAQAMVSNSIPDGNEPDSEDEGSGSLGDIPQLDMAAGDDRGEAAEEGPEAVRPRVTIEEVVDEENFWFVEEFAEEAQAGATFGKGPTTFQAIRDDQVLRGAEVLGPFASDDEWELAKWLIKNVGHNQMEAFLKLPIVSLTRTGENWMELTRLSDPGC